MCGDSSVYGAFYCSSDHGSGALSRCGLKLTETFRQHVRWLFLFRPHIVFSMLSSSPGPVITERLKQHALLLLPLGATPCPITCTDPHMETKRLQFPTNGPLALNCNDKGSKNRRTIADCSCLNFFLNILSLSELGMTKKRWLLRAAGQVQMKQTKNYLVLPNFGRERWRSGNIILANKQQLPQCGLSKI